MTVYRLHVSMLEVLVYFNALSRHGGSSCTLFQRKKSTCLVCLGRSLHVHVEFLGEYSLTYTKEFRK